MSEIELALASQTVRVMSSRLTAAQVNAGIGNATGVLLSSVAQEVGLPAVGCALQEWDDPTKGPLLQMAVLNRIAGGVYTRRMVTDGRTVRWVGHSWTGDRTHPTAAAQGMFLWSTNDAWPN